MNYLYVALIYLGFFSLIAFATYFTGSAWCLLALLCTPAWNRGTKDDEEDEEEEDEE